VKKNRSREKNEEEIVVKVLLDSGAIELVMSSEFTKKNKFRKKLDRPIYMRNINSTFNYEKPIEYIVEIELFFKDHKKRTE